MWRDSAPYLNCLGNVKAPSTTKIVSISFEKFSHLPASEAQAYGNYSGFCSAWFDGEFARCPAIERGWVCFAQLSNADRRCLWRRHACATSNALERQIGAGLRAVDRGSWPSGRLSRPSEPVGVG